MFAAEKLRGRALPLAILAGVVFGASLLVALPLVILFGWQSDDIEQSKRMLIAYRMEIASRPALEAELAGLNRREASSPSLLQGGSAALAAANMQNLVTALIQSHGGQIRSAQNLPSSSLGGLEKIEVEYDLSIPLGSLPGVAYQLETSQPLLFLNNVDLKVWETLRTDGSESLPPNLQVHWIIQGYRWADAS